jgi:hypothetical protein
MSGTEEYRIPPSVTQTCMIRTEEYRIPPSLTQTCMIRTKEYRIPPSPTQTCMIRTEEYRIPPSLDSTSHTAKIIGFDPGSQPFSSIFAKISSDMDSRKVLQQCPSVLKKRVAHSGGVHIPVSSSTLKHFRQQRWRKTHAPGVQLFLFQKLRRGLHFVSTWRCNNRAQLTFGFSASCCFSALAIETPTSWLPANNSLSRKGGLTMPASRALRISCAALCSCCCTT